MHSPSCSSCTHTHRIRLQADLCVGNLGGADRWHSTMAAVTVSGDGYHDTSSLIACVCVALLWKTLSCSLAICSLQGQAVCLCLNCQDRFCRSIPSAHGRGGLCDLDFVSQYFFVFFMVTVLYLGIMKIKGTLQSEHVFPLFTLLAV